MPLDTYFVINHHQPNFLSASFSDNCSMQSCDCAESSRTNTGGSRRQDCHPRRTPTPLVAAGVSTAISVRCALFTSPSCGPRCEEERSIFIARRSWNWKRGKDHEDENKEIEGEVMRFLWGSAVVFSSLSLPPSLPPSPSLSLSTGLSI